MPIAAAGGPLSPAFGMPMKKPLPRPKSIFVDVDGTLISKSGQINTNLIKSLWSWKAKGYQLYLWSMNGSAHANRAVSRCGCEGLFEAVLSKPGVIVDDRGLEWLQGAPLLGPSGLAP